MKVLNSAGHLTEKVLLLIEDDELNPSAMLAAKKHLAGCDPCRQRQAAIQSWVSELCSPTAPAIPGEDAARALLQTRLELAARTPQPPLGQWVSTHIRPGLTLAFASAAAVLIVVLTWFVSHNFATRPSAIAASEPDRTITPGGTRPAALSELCRLKDDDLDPKVSPEKVHQVFRAYRIDERAAAEYQVDYLINPQLGGSDSLQNLWPEPSSSTLWNASAKDALEMRLHTMVCDGELRLETAQHDLATDWIAAYKKYFGVLQPATRAASSDEASGLQLALGDARDSRVVYNRQTSR